MTPSPDDWKEATKFLWTFLLLPVGMVWKRVNGAVQKEDFKEAMQEIATELKEHAKQDRETHLALFKKLDEMADDQSDLKATAARVEATLTFIVPNGPSNRR